MKICLTWCQILLSLNSVSILFEDFFKIIFYYDFCWFVNNSLLLLKCCKVQKCWILVLLWTFLNKVYPNVSLIHDFIDIKIKKLTITSFKYH